MFGIVCFDSYESMSVLATLPSGSAEPGAEDDTAGCAGRSHRLKTADRRYAAASTAQSYFCSHCDGFLRKD